MSARDDAAQAVAEARGALVRRLHPWTVDPGQADEIADRLIAAVRHHDAETVRAMDPYEIALAGQHARDDIANALDPATKDDAPPEVVVRYDDGLIIRLRDFDVDTDPTSRSIDLEGQLASGTGWPRTGNTVRIAELRIPGRGALADLDANISLYTLDETTVVRIRATLAPA